jgi:hypothetical protein
VFTQEISTATVAAAVPVSAERGQHYVALNTGAGYTYTSDRAASGWTPVVVDFNADSFDLFLYNKTNGKWFELQGNGAGQFSVWAAERGLPDGCVSDGLHGDSRSDLLL